MLNSDYQQRRKKMLELIGKNGIGILPAAPEIIRSGDAHYPYRQDSDFYYLTGFSEPEAVALFIPGHADGEFILFNRVRDPEREIWDGPRAGQIGACEIVGANKSYPISELMQRLPQYLTGRQKIYYDLGQYCTFDVELLNCVDSLRKQIRSGVNAPTDFSSLKQFTHEMRLIKSEYELSSIRYVTEVSAQAHCRAMKYCKPGLMEYHLAAEINHEFQKNDCAGPAYTSIVGGGKNACVLHYITNDAKLVDGDLVLIDAGAEYRNYAADITRTFPVNGKFSPEQKAIYELVLSAQKAAIEVVRPQTPWPTIQETIIKVFTLGLKELGILKGDVETLLENKAYREFYMHNSGHWLGLDVHDVGSYKPNGEWRQLKAGMVLTVEPGIYIRGNNPNVDKKWWNIGVRIEDDVLVTPSGCEVLTKSVPKEINDIENLMK